MTMPVLILEARVPGAAGWGGEIGLTSVMNER
jgi:hypothetical protein